MCLWEWMNFSPPLPLAVKIHKLLGSNDKTAQLRWPLMSNSSASRFLSIIRQTHMIIIFMVSSMPCTTKITRSVDNIFSRATLTVTLLSKQIRKHWNWPQVGHEFRCVQTVQSQLTSALSRFFCDSMADLHAHPSNADFRDGGRPHFCVVLSPLWGVLHYFPTATSEYPHIPSAFLSALPCTEALYHITPSISSISF